MEPPSSPWVTRTSGEIDRWADAVPPRLPLYDCIDEFVAERSRAAMTRVAADLLPLAHQGGWDEILIVALPLGVIGGLLYLANKRVDAKLAEHADDEAPSTK